ncbi:MAG TPA: hypothetical protein VKR58_03380 [Aquella sp.]|nr:hypothetical protein [Aquella sp.]
MSVYLEQAKILLAKVDLLVPEVKEAQDLLNSLTKTAAVTDLIHDPKFQNIVTLLTPFLVNYKVNQVIKLLKELEKESRTGNKQYL